MLLPVTSPTALIPQTLQPDPHAFESQLCHSLFRKVIQPLRPVPRFPHL